MYIHVYIYVYIYNIYIYYRVNIKQKNTFLFLTNILVVLHNLLQCVWIKHLTKSLHTQQKLKLIK